CTPRPGGFPGLSDRDRLQAETFQTHAKRQIEQGTFVSIGDAFKRVPSIAISSEWKGVRIDHRAILAASVPHGNSRAVSQWLRIGAPAFVQQNLSATRAFTSKRYVMGTRPKSRGLFCCLREKPSGRRSGPEAR